MPMKKSESTALEKTGSAETGNASADLKTYKGGAYLPFTDSRSLLI